MQSRKLHPHQHPHSDSTTPTTATAHTYTHNCTLLQNSTSDKSLTCLKSPASAKSSLLVSLTKSPAVPVLMKPRLVLPLLLQLTQFEELPGIQGARMLCTREGCIAKLNRITAKYQPVGRICSYHTQQV